VHTDWLIVRRLAAELDRAVRNARIREAGLTADGRFALRVRARGAGGDALVIDPFGDLPLITLEHGVELGVRPGWPRTIADAVGGMRIEAVRSRRGDRLVAIDVATLSRFGVLSSYRLVAELVPRFGNVLLLRDDIVVAAAREFTREQNARRSVAVGERYVPPPLPEAGANPPDLAEPLARVLARSDDGAAREEAVRALRARVPLLPQLVAASLVAEAAKGGSTPASLVDRLVARAVGLVEAADGEPEGLGDTFVYRDGGEVAHVHIVRLHQFPGLSETREPELLPPLMEALEADRSARGVRSAGALKASLQARVTRRREALDVERRRLDREFEDVTAADVLREQGELLYAHLAEVPGGANSFVPPSHPGLTIPLDPLLDAKENATAIFRKYRKALAKRTHVERRIAENAGEAEAAEDLAWELERAEPGALDELREDVDRLEHRPRAVGSRGRQPRRTALEVPLGIDARILVGRSPQNNADLTFRIARPDDLWFHARGVPGAHVVLRIDSARQPTNAELRSAAELAAFHSKARTSGTVPVDYTARKYVRKQQNAMPGMVWYVNAKTIDVTPKAAQ
jgi:predicted ribosome quality control (RQC) complex YloA/Tae2 family protein